jgi:hypothetical protein
MQAANTSETSVNFTGLHCATTQMTATFRFAVVKTSVLNKILWIGFNWLETEFNARML